MTWLISGNIGTNPASDFLGTRDNQALEVRVNNQRALRIEPDASSPNLIGGHEDNNAQAGVEGAVIGGGGRSGFPNRITAEFGVVGGGLGNLVSGERASIGGGTGNQAAGLGATIGGGASNQTGANFATVCGGLENEAGGPFAAVGGGEKNAADGAHAFAAGKRAKAVHNGTFVWADSTDEDFTSVADNQFLVRATGGFDIKTSRLAITGDLAVKDDEDREVMKFDADPAALSLGSAGNPGSLIARNNSGETSVHVDGSDGALTLGPAHAELFRVQQDGNVGIGTSNPLANLHVARDVRADGNLLLNGDLNVAGAIRGKLADIGIAVAAGLQHEQSIPVPTGFARSECTFYAALKYVLIDPDLQRHPVLCTVDSNGKISISPKGNGVVMGFAIAKKGGW